MLCGALCCTRCFLCSAFAVFCLDNSACRRGLRFRLCAVCFWAALLFNEYALIVF